MTLFRKDKRSATFQRELYRLHYRRIYNTCLRIIGNSMDAEEAMHDVFLKLFDHMDELQDEKAFHSWSRQIAIRTSIDRTRKKKLVFEQVDNLPIVDEEPDEEPVLSVEAIKRGLDSLPDGYRIVVSMRLLEECEFEEIAQALQIKESTVRSQYIRGREKLAAMLKLKIEC
ncbi:MAG: RNA polymerase sigma factor [Bacteroidales bacterium]|nr:RNA polymerase sigma factor [Bacteroidales bacterium]